MGGAGGRLARGSAVGSEAADEVVDLGFEFLAGVAVAGLQAADQLVAAAGDLVARRRR
jgi:hypothetical protein